MGSLSRVISQKKLQVTDETNRFLICVCPFHAETRGSLVINKQENRGKPKGFWYCFGCRAFGEITGIEIDSLVVSTGSDIHIPKNEDLELLQESYFLREFEEDKARDLADQFNVDVRYVNELCVGWDGQAHTFPMYNEHHEVIGIHRRWDNGFKLMVEGSSLGLFISNSMSQGNKLVVTEGASDLITAISMGFNGIAKPNALTGKRLVYKWLHKNCPGYERIVIVADADEAGIRGARELQDYIDSEHKRSVIFVPIQKDLRAELEAYDKVFVAAHIRGLFDGPN